MEHTNHEENNTHTDHEEKHENASHHGHDEQNKEELRLSGDDIVAFIRKIFKAGNSRQVVWRDEDNGKILKLNLILMALIFFIVPIFALIVLIILILMNHSLTIEKKKVV
ncbi:MAG: DUF4342 domain-containing protein [Patescibacteria group bacterium]